MFERMRPGYYVLIALAIFEFSLAFVLGKSDLANYLNTSGLKTMLVPMGALFPLLWVGGLTFAVTRRQVSRPTAAMRRMIYRDRRWLARGTFFALMILLLARSFSSYKGAIPEISPYWADPWLASVDHAIFGTDPWHLTHAVIGPLGTMIIDRVYALWFIVMMLCMGWFCFTRNAALQLRGLLSYLVCWALLGNIVATWLSSVGPVFYQRFFDDDRFVPLIDLLHRTDGEHRLMALGAMRYLTSMIGQDRMGGGISAMPSLHVSIAFLVFLASCTYANSRLLKIATGLFAATIMVGSVHLGWHYAVDGIVGIVAVSLIWWGTGRFVDWLDARDRAASLSAPFTALPATI